MYQSSMYQNSHVPKTPYPDTQNQSVVSYYGKR